jgi:hypothetical protein
MAEQGNDEDGPWQAIKYWLSITLMIAALILMLWIFVLESIH